ncbi:MAG: biotin synthase BioB [Bdellovibrionales bacterium]|nr:biotin synthase BioB [Bdellovibrionales bacterium]
MNNTIEIRNNWSTEEVREIYETPLLELIFRAAEVHRHFHDPSEVQVCTLLSVKTGGCSEDCGYCSQSMHHETSVKAQPLLEVEQTLEAARRAKHAGSTRFCMGAAWREVKDNRAFERVLEMIEGVSSMGLEVCCTLGMVTEEQAIKLRKAGLHAYNHNIDTSESFYDKIITTRSFSDRLETLNNVRKAGLTVCCGGIIGLGESEQDRCEMLQILASFDPHPESVPINALVAVPGTAMANQEPVKVWDFVRSIATARILMPASMVRLSAGRLELSEEAQAICFLAGANSIFSGDKLLTTPNPNLKDDEKLFDLLGLKPRQAHKSETSQKAQPLLAV